MRDVFITLVALIILYLVASVLSHIKPVKVALIKKVTAKMEKKYQCCEKSGKKKKANALKILKWILIRIDKGTTLIIDIVVDLANEKNDDMVASLKSVTRSEVNAKLAKLSSANTNDNDNNYGEGDYF